MRGAFVGYVKADKISGVLIYRRRFPQELVPFIPLADRAGLGRKELRVSLQGKTMDDPGVGLRWQSVKAEFDEIVQNARAAEEVARKKGEGQFDAVTPPLIAYLAEAFRHETLENDETARWDVDERNLFKDVAEQLRALGVTAVSPWTGRESVRWAEKARERISEALARYQAIRGSGDQDALLAEWQEEALGYAEARGHIFDPSALPDMIALCRAFNDAAISAAKDRLKRLDGDEYPATPAEPVAPVSPDQKGAPPAAVPLLGLFDGYAAAQGISPGVRKEWRNYIDILIQFLGHDDAARLTWEDVSGWCDHSSDAGSAMLFSLSPPKVRTAIYAFRPSLVVPPAQAAQNAQREMRRQTADAAASRAAYEANQKALADYRKSLQIGAVTNCGMIIDMRGAVAQLQQNGVYSGVTAPTRWVRVDQLLPKGNACPADPFQR